ncbi:uncharacterized protein [Mytilus edulis]|uniref:uncharacterized protein n=1 Tax=Mytilus edulis TaxID=6550 RepID=UPI0039EF6B85
MVTEVLPKNSRYVVNKSELALEGYDIFPENFPPNNGRGIIMYIKQELQAVEITFNHDFKEFTCAKINLMNNDKLLVGCIYKSPSSTEENHRLLNELLLKISNLEEKYTHILLTGDFNFPSINWETWSAKDSISENFLECIRDCFFQQMVDQPTRYRINQEPSLLYLVLVNDKDFINNIEYQEPVGHSDHNVLVFDYKCYIKQEVSKSEKFNYFKADFEMLRQDLNVNWEELLTDKNTEEKVSAFMDRLQIAMNNHIPKMKVSKKKFNKEPLSVEARRVIRKKHRAWEKYSNKRDNDSYREYTKARNKAKSTVIRERKNREKDIAESAKTNCKHFWSYINSKRKSKSGISELHDKRDGKTFIASNCTDKAEILAEFFTSVFTKEDDEDETFLKEGRKIPKGQSNS